MLLFNVFFPKLFFRRVIFYYFKTIPSRRSPFCCSSLLHPHYAALCVHCHTPGRGTRPHPLSRPGPFPFHLAAAPMARRHPLNPKIVLVAFPTQTRSIASPAEPLPQAGPGARGSPPIATAVGLRAERGAGAGAALPPVRPGCAVAAVPL